MKKGKKRAVTGFSVFLGLMLVIAVFFFINFKTIEVSGISMLDTLKDHQRVLITKAYWLVGPIRQNDIVAIKDPGGPGYIIKRVKWTAGQDVDPDWRPVNAPWKGSKYIVPEGHVYVLGDNRPVSEDSRKFGFVDVNTILGKVLVLKKR